MTDSVKEPSNELSNELSNKNQPENEMSAGDFLSWALRGMLKVLYGTVLLGMFLSAIHMTNKSIFEHGQGWNDLDSLEILFFLLLFGFQGRFFSKAKACGLNWWQRTSRFVHVIGAYQLAVNVPLLMVVMDERFLPIVQPHFYTIDLITLFGYVFVIYAMTPIPAVDSIDGKAVESTESDDNNGVGTQTEQGKDAA